MGLDWMTGLSLGENFSLICECGGDVVHIEDRTIECEDCHKPLDEDVYWELEILGALHHIGFKPERVTGIRRTWTNDGKEPRLVLTMKDNETLTLCKVIKEEHLQPKKV